MDAFATRLSATGGSVSFMQRTRGRKGRVRRMGVSFSPTRKYRKQIDRLADSLRRTISIEPRIALSVVRTSGAATPSHAYGGASGCQKLVAHP